MFTVRISSCCVFMPFSVFPDNFPSQDTTTGHSGWHLYREALIDNRIKHTTHQWYARHAKRFLEFHKDSDYKHMTKYQMEQHILAIPTEWFEHDWQAAQYIDAVRILLIYVFKLPWASKFPWQSHISATKTITTAHPTLARETTNNTPLAPKLSTQLSSARCHDFFLIIVHLKITLP